MTHTLRCIVVTLVVPLVALAAQEAPVVQSGSRVRVTNNQYGVHTERMAGTLESIDSATIVLRRDNGERVTVPRIAGTQLDVSRGPGACTGRRGSCIGIGFLGGAAMGVLAGLAAGGASSSNNCDGCANGLVFFLTVPVGAVMGTIIGAVVGGEHWQSVTPPARLSIAPNGRRGLTLGLSLPL